MAFSITSLCIFFEGETKSISRGENHYKSGHVESITYIPGVLKGKVCASMKDKVYNVMVSFYYFFMLVISKALARFELRTAPKFAQSRTSKLL